MVHVPIEEVFALMGECFPEVAPGDLTARRDRLTAFKHGESGFVLSCPYVNGYAILYLGVAARERRSGVASRMLAGLTALAGSRSMYAEVVENSPMYALLTKAGWVKLPISYVCPAWENEPADDSRCLMTNTPGADHLAFLEEFYREGYRAPSPRLLERYRWELNTFFYTEAWRDRFTALFRASFRDDIGTILDSLDRASLRLVRDGERLVGFMLYHPYEELRAVAVEYVAVAEDHRRRRIGFCLFDRLYAEYPGWAFYGEVHRGTPITDLLLKDGWRYAKVKWVCPAWGDIPEDATRSLICRGARDADVPAFAKAFYEYGYGVKRDDLIARYRRETENNG